MARGRKLKKGGGDLEIHNQNVASPEQTIGQQNVAPLELRPKEKKVVPLKLKIDE